MIPFSLKFCFVICFFTEIFSFPQHVVKISAITMINEWENNEEIKLLQEYLRIPSVHPNPNYEPCVEFLKRQAKNLNLPVAVHYPRNEDNPLVVITWQGLEPNLPSIVLNSHMDVVPVFEEFWNHPPFGAEIDKDGKIYARGAQDMKSLGTMYLGAIRELIREGFKPNRTFHLLFVPDEEVGGKYGMAPFVKTDAFSALNVGFALDEGHSSPTNEYELFYGERTVWQPKFKCNGPPGHGMLLLKNTAGEKVEYILRQMMQLRSQELQKLEDNPNLVLGDVTTINLTEMKGGVQENVIPPYLTIGFDIRLAKDMSQDEMNGLIEKWVQEAGGDIEITYRQKEPQVEPTKMDESNKYWITLKKAFDEMGFTVKPQILSGGTDMRYLRNLGIPAFGFTPFTQTPYLNHNHDEFIKADTYLKAIETYKTIIKRVGSLL